MTDLDEPSQSVGLRIPTTGGQTLSCFHDKRKEMEEISRRTWPQHTHDLH